MLMNKEKVKVFVKKNKNKLIAAGATMVMVGGGIALAIITKKTPKIEVLKTFDTPKIPVPKELEKYGVEILSESTVGVELMADGKSLSTNDLGAFGKALCSMKTILPEDKVWLLVMTSKRNES